MQDSNQTNVEEDDLSVVVPVITNDVNMLGIPGVLVEMSPDEAESWGADESDPVEVEAAWLTSLSESQE